VTRRFLELQGPDLNEGLVFRAYTPFTPLATHSRSGMPLTREYRVFWLDGVPLATVPYWEEGAYDAGEQPPVAQFAQVAAQAQSRFFTMDLAQRVDDGAWLIVELGDGQVAGLPERLDVAAFYRQLAEKWPIA
ncbi:MAG: ATP-grasp domain-containing protein, partial [Ktedonobacterales bacterium]